jgi:hypothetical protein
VPGVVQKAKGHLMSRMHPDDRNNTISLLKRNSAVTNSQTWLRHKADGESGIIDQMVLKGTYDIDQMIDLLSENPKLKSKSRSQWEKRIKDHLLHLSTAEGDSRNRASGQGGHNLPVIESASGKIKFGL